MNQHFHNARPRTISAFVKELVIFLVPILRVPDKNEPHENSVNAVAKNVANCVGAT